MATIILSACVGYRTRHSGYETVTSLPFNRVGERETIEAANVTAIRCAVAAYGARLQAEHPDASFLVLVSVARESRKPNGFDATRRNGGFACNAWLKPREETSYAAPANESPAETGAGVSVLLTEPPEPAANRHEIGGTVVETVRRTDGWWLYRCPEILPINARHWRGHFESEKAAVADFIARRRIPRLTPADLQRKKRCDHYAVINGRELVLHRDPLSGATVLTPFELVRTP